MLDVKTHYREKEKHEFEFESCWLILKNCPKFNSRTSERKPLKRNARVEEVENDQLESEMDSSITSSRPVGAKKAKKALAESALLAKQVETASTAGGKQLASAFQYQNGRS
jgi:hypothetical protein